MGVTEEQAKEIVLDTASSLGVEVAEVRVQQDMAGLVPVGVKETTLDLRESALDMSEAGLRFSTVHAVYLSRDGSRLRSQRFTWAWLPFITLSVTCIALFLLFPDWNATKWIALIGGVALFLWKFRADVDETLLKTITTTRDILSAWEFVRHADEQSRGNKELPPWAWKWMLRTWNRTIREAEKELGHG
jgi:hypothetical protein